MGASSTSAALPAVSNATVSSLLSAGLITRQEAMAFSPNQLAFLARKRSPAPPPTATSRHGEAAPTNAHSSTTGNVRQWLSQGLITQQEVAVFSPEQLAFLARKRSHKPLPTASAGAAAAPAAAHRGSNTHNVQQWLARRLITQQEVSSFSMEQLAFLARKRGA